MKIIIIGEKDESMKYDFRETCFGLYIKDNEILVTIDPKRNQYTLVGGDYPMESLAHFYTIDIDEYLTDVETEGEYKFVNINEVNLPLPYPASGTRA